MWKSKRRTYSTSNPVDITVWTYYNGEQLSSFNTLVKKFNRTQGKENGIHVESVSCGTVSDLEKNLKDSIEKKVGASEIPDMFSAYNDIAYTIDQMHGIVAVSYTHLDVYKRQCCRWYYWFVVKKWFKK